MMMVEVQKNIIAMGGGSFPIQRDLMRLERYALQQLSAKRPKICFVPTASGESPEYVVKFYEAFGHFDAELTHLSFFKPSTNDLADFLLRNDMIYVGGGNTKSMLALWREWGVDQIMHEAWGQGIMLCGVSAGAICWFEEGITDSFPDALTSMKCLGFLSGSSCPHYDGEADRRPSFHRMLQAGQVSDGIALDDGAAVHYRGREIHKIVSSRPDAKAYRLENVSGEVKETALAVDYLG